MRFIFFILLAISLCILAHAQPSDSLTARSSESKADRFRSPAFDVYRKRSILIGGIPQGAYIRNNENGKYQASLGFDLKAGYFITDGLAIGLSTGIFDTWSNVDVFSNAQWAGILAQYFFFERKRVTPYVGLRLTTLRFVYEPKADWQFLNDSIDGKRHTHYLPFFMAPLGVNVKWTRHFTSNFGLGYKRSLHGNLAGRSPSGGSFFFDFGVNYHIKRVVGRNTKHAAIGKW